MWIGLAFWILMLLALVGVVYVRWPQGPGVYGIDLLTYLLLALLGWHSFGAPLHG